MKQYCTYCGREMIEYEFDTLTYDRQTGKKVIKKYFKCPKRDYFLGSLHDDDRKEDNE